MAWSGQVVEVQLQKRVNLVEDLVKVLPDNFLRIVPLTCFLGERYKHCSSSSTASTPSSLVCRLRRESHLPAWQTCHLEQWATYSYSITVRMAATYFGGKEELVKLDVDGMTKLADLAEGSHLEFAGTLRLGFDQPMPIVTITHINNH